MNNKPKLNLLLLKFDRAFSEKIWRQILILFGFFIIAFAIGLLICYFLTFGLNGRNANISFFEWALYLLIDSNALNFIYTDEYPEGGRTWTVIFAVLGSLLGIILFGGMLISVLSNMLERRIENYRSGKNTYLKKGHHVILGYDEIVPSIIKRICQDPKAYVLLQSSLPAPEVLEKIRISIAQEYLDRIIIKYGHRTSEQDLKELRLKKAQEIFVVGNRTSPYHDAENITCIEKIYNILKEGKKEENPSSITVVIEDYDTFSAMQIVDLFKEIRNLGIELITYNFYNDWAKQILVDNKYELNGKIYLYPLLDDEGIDINDKRHLHLVIVGTSNFGVSIAIQAAQTLHFPNFKKGENLTRITFIDLNADKEKEVFKSRFRHFFEVQSHWYNGEKIPPTKFKDEDADFLDVEFEFINGDIFSPEIQNQLKKWAEDKSQLLSLFISTKNSLNNAQIAFNLPDEIYENNIPIFVRQNSSGKFLNILQKESDKDFTKITVEKGELKQKSIKGKYSHIFPFGMTDVIFDINREYQTYAAYINISYNFSPDQIRQIPWEVVSKEWKTLSVAHQWSNLYCAYSFKYKLRSIKANFVKDDSIKKLNESEIEILSRIEHNRWNVEKLILGYRKPEEKEDKNKAVGNFEKNELENFKNKNKELFIHCDIVPFEHLEEETSDKDRKIVQNIPFIIEISNNKYNKNEHIQTETY